MMFGKKLSGGVGYGAYVLLNEVSADADALGPDNKLIFATGPVQATSFPGSAKFSVISKSPLSGLYGESAAGARMGVAAKQAGYDAIIVEGEADRPKRLLINSDGGKIIDAEDLWGLDSLEANDAILKEEEKDGEKELSTASIGQAGENLVRYAAIGVDKHSFFGRSGMGAVMGSKNLKAVSVEPGDENPDIGAGVDDLNREITSKVAKEGELMRKDGTPAFVSILNEFGDVPTKNWAKGDFEYNEDISAARYTEELLKGRLPCANCPIGCHRDVKIESPEKYAAEGAGPEYETLAMIGQNCLIGNLKAIAKANEVCNRYGIDTISLGPNLGFLMEAQERGYIDKDETEVDFSWGNPDAPIEFAEKVAKRKGIGDVAAEGIKSLVEELGEESEEFAVQLKGVDLPAHDPRAFFGTSLNYATGVRGPGHERGNLQMPYLGSTLPEVGIGEEPERFSMENIPYLVARYQDWSSIWNSLVVCRFMTECGCTFSTHLDMFNATTELNYTTWDFIKAGERIFNLQRLINIKYGLSRKDEKLPPRIYEDTGEGGHEGKVPDNLDPVLDKYYELRGWTENGVPTEEHLQKLGILDLVEIDLSKILE